MRVAERHPSTRPSQPFNGRFDMSDDGEYLRWRAKKLAGFPADSAQLVVRIGDLANPTERERAEIVSRCRATNMAIYATGADAGDESGTRHGLCAFARAFGLRQMEDHRSAARDGFVALQVSEDSERRGYIPYSNRPLTWHTDGYYNSPEHRVRAFLLHCIRDADEGGENAFLDPEIAYIRLRDENPDFVTALMHPEVMTIPENREASGKVRPVSRGPVFAVDPHSGMLHMRYSARGRNVIWRDDRNTTAARAFLTDLLAGDEPFILKHKLTPGQGLICNNVLHCRSGFGDARSPDQGKERLLLRARYTDRISGAA